METNKVLYAVNEVAEELKRNKIYDDKKILELVLEVNKLIIENHKLKEKKRIVESIFEDKEVKRALKLLSEQLIIFKSVYPDWLFILEKIMKDSIDFGKVQTYEELKMLRELEKHYKKHPVKHKRKYSRDVSKIKLKGGG